MRTSAYKALLAALTGFALLFGTGGASADTVSYTLTVANTGSGLGSGPFGTVLLDRTSSSTVNVTFTAGAGYAFLDGTSAGLNVAGTFSASTPTTAGSTPTGYTCSALTSCGTAPHIPTFTANIGSANISQFGSFNFQMDASDGWASGTQTISFVLTATGSNSWASAASVLTANNNGNVVVAHVGTNGGANTGFSSVPIPAAAWLFGSGLIGLIGIARRKLAA